MLSWPWVAGWLHTTINVWHRELNPDTVAHLSTNRDRCRLTLLIKANALTTTPDHQPGCELHIALWTRSLSDACRYWVGNWIFTIVHSFVLLLSLRCLRWLMAYVHLQVRPVCVVQVLFCQNYSRKLLCYTQPNMSHQRPKCTVRYLFGLAT